MKVSGLACLMRWQSSAPATSSSSLSNEDERGHPDGDLGENLAGVRDLDDVVAAPA